MPSRTVLPADPAITAAVEIGEINRGIKDILHNQNNDAQARNALTAKALAKPEIPAPLKWAGGIVAALFTAGIATLAGWLVFTVSDMQVTLARMDERQQFQTTAQDGRFGEIDRRLDALESHHASGGSR